MTKKIVSILGLLIGLIAVLVAIYIVVYGVSKAIERQDRATCERFSVDMQERPGFYLTDSEQAMCDYLKVDIIPRTQDISQL